MNFSLKKTLFSSLVALMMVNSSSQLFISAQGGTSNTNRNNNNESTEEVSSEEEEVSEETQGNNNSQAKIKFDEIETEVQNYLNPETMDLLFEGTESYSISDESGDLTTTLDGYRLYEITKFSRNAKIPFGDQRDEGGVIVLHFTITNDSDEDVYVGNPPTIEFPNTYISNTSLVEHDKTDILLKTFEGPLPAGEELSGFLTYAITPEEMEIISQEPQALMDFPGFRPEEEYDHTTEILGAQDMTIPFSDEATEAVANLGDFYPDKMVAENWGSKEIIEEEELKDVTGEFDGVTISLDGYQISKFTPNSEQESRFTGFKDGVITINIPMTVENNSDQTIDLRSAYASLVLGDLVEVKNDLMVEVDPEVEEIPEGESGTYYLTFLVDGELYSKFEKDTLKIYPSLSNTDYENAIDYQSIELVIERD